MGVKYETDPLDPMAVPIWEAFQGGLYFTVNCDVSIKPGSPCSICRELEQRNLLTRTRDHFHGSDLGSCSRKVYYAMTVPHSFSSSTGQSFLNDGHMHEALVLSTISVGFGDKAQILRYSNEEEAIVEFGKDIHVKIVGHPDGYIKYNGLEAIIECKAVKDYTFDKVKGGEISREWYGQAQYYLLAKKLSVAYFIVKNRITSKILRPIRIDFDSKWIKERLIILQNIMGMIMGVIPHQIPDREYRKNSGECKFCPYFSSCWSDGTEPLSASEQSEQLLEIFQ